LPSLTARQASSPPPSAEKPPASGLDTEKCAKADRCADYLHNKQPYLDYPTALVHGWPIGTGVIEGACRHLVKDRMDRTGARWGLEGAEAVLKLRALRSNRDLEDYWRFHVTQERRPLHLTNPLRQRRHPTAGITSLQVSRTPFFSHKPGLFARCRRRPRGAPALRHRRLLGAHNDMFSRIGRQRRCFA
jgi:hypothetical protein